MQQFRPDIKPPMWGPPSAVQFAVRVNAEKIGLNPVCFVPFWEFGGVTQVFDVFGGVVTPQSTNANWDWSGLRSGSPSNLDNGIYIYPRTPVSNQGASLIFGLRQLESDSTFKDFVSIGLSASWRASVSKPSNNFDFVSYGNPNPTGWSSSGTITIPATETIPIALSLDRAASSKRLYVAGKSASSSHTPSEESVNAVRLFNRLGDNNRTTRGTALYFGLFDSPLTQAQATRFEYEPYTLLMPVARPLYFDLGSVEPGTDNLTPQNIATDSPVITSPTIGQVHVLTAQGVAAGSPVVSTPTLSIVDDVDDLIGQDVVAGAPTVTTATLGQIHVLGGDGVALGSPTITTPALTVVDENTVVLTGQDIVSGAPTVSTPAIGQVHALLGQDIVAGAPTITIESEKVKRGGGGGYTEAPAKAAKPTKRQARKKPTKPKVIEFTRETEAEKQAAVQRILTAPITDETPAPQVTPQVAKTDTPSPFLVPSPAQTIDPLVIREAADLLMQATPLDAPGAMQPQAIAAQEVERIAMMRMRDEDEAESLIMIFASV